MDFFLDRYAESFLVEMQQFVRCILEDREPAPGGEDGLRAIELALAAQRSLRERRPVRVGEAA
jgi:myo-inositol 2-dehydrogenase/D-chiro-inositol 1-dehydrogenase